MTHLRLSVRRLAVIAIVTMFAAPATAWAVGSTPVTVVNPADLAKAQGIQHPAQFLIVCDSTLRPATPCDTLSVPANQRYVIEYASAVCGVPAGGHITQLGLGTTVGLSSLIHHLPFTEPAVTTAHDVSVGQVVRIYADSSTGVTPFVIADPGFVCFFTVSGQLVDVP